MGIACFCEHCGCCPLCPLRAATSSAQQGIHRIDQECSPNAGNVALCKVPSVLLRNWGCAEHSVVVLACGEHEWVEPFRLVSEQRWQLAALQLCGLLYLILTRWVRPSTLGFALIRECGHRADIDSDELVVSFCRARFRFHYGKTNKINTVSRVAESKVGHRPHARSFMLPICLGLPPYKGGVPDVLPRPETPIAALSVAEAKTLR